MIPGYVRRAFIDTTCSTEDNARRGRRLICLMHIRPPSGISITFNLIRGEPVSSRARHINASRDGFSSRWITRALKARRRAGSRSRFGEKQEDASSSQTSTSVTDFLTVEEKFRAGN